MTVAFFGHSDTPSDIRPLLEQKIHELAGQNEDMTFLVGTHGAFDRMAQRALEKALKQHPHIKAYIVLAYYEPTVVKEEWEQYILPTLYPEGIELKPKRFAIDFCNNYMVQHCDTVICFVRHDWGGAAKFVGKAERKGKTIINLVDEKEITKTT